MNKPVLVTDDKVIIQIPKITKKNIVAGLNNTRMGIGTVLYKMGKKLITTPDIKINPPKTPETPEKPDETD